MCEVVKRGLLCLELVACASWVACATTSPRRSAPPAARQAAVKDLIHQAAARHGVEVALVQGVIEVESGYQVQARSAVGARGLMQLMPRTAASLARQLQWEDYDIEDPAFNVEAGTAYLAYLLKRFGGNRRLALAAYNAGPTRVEQWVDRGRTLPAESQRYVRAVLGAREHYVDNPSFAPQPQLDTEGLRALLKEKLYGLRPDEPLDG